MFRNIGRKIKVVAKVFFWIGFALGILGGAAAVVAGIYAFAHGGWAIGIGAIVGGILFAGLMYLLSWLSVMLLYGFGELVDNSTRFIRMLENESKAEDGTNRTQM